MFDKFSEQFGKSFKPVSELFAVNAKAMEKMVQQQTAYVTSVMNDGVTFTRSLADQKDLNGVLEVQKHYAEDLQEKFVSATKDAYALVTETQEQAGELLKDMFSQVSKEAEGVVAKATKAAASATSGSSKSATASK